MSFARDAGAVEQFRLTVSDCPCCGDGLSELEGKEICPNCKSRARTRTLAPVLGELHRRTPIPNESPWLAFALTKRERLLLSPFISAFCSVSLFGSYGEDHCAGVDARDLSRFEEGQFSGHFSSLLFDYFVEHSVALAEACRVIVPGGIFLTHISPGRLVEGEKSPYLKGVIDRKPGYFEYLPAERDLPNARVGRAWFLAEMQRQGFAASRFVVMDRASGIENEWFVGLKG